MCLDGLCECQGREARQDWKVLAKMSAVWVSVSADPSHGGSAQRDVSKVNGFWTLENQGVCEGLPQGGYMGSQRKE